MSALARFERLVENLMEDSVARFFRTRIQPAEIARRLERAMESQQSISVGRVIVPNVYRVYLSPEDFTVIASYKSNLEREMAEDLVDLAKERGFSMLHHPRVELGPDPGVGKRQIQVVAEMQEALADLGGGSTQVISIDSGPQTQRSQPRASLVLHTDQGEHTIPIGSTLVTIGRALNNDIILDDSRVSRHHAEIRYKARRFWVTDLGSTNGTFVNNEPVAEQPLRSGDIVSLGGLEMIFREG